MIDTSTFTQSQINQIFAGEGHTILLTEDSQLFATGWNNFGQCAIPNAGENILTFHKINLPPLQSQNALKIIYFSSGQNHNIMLTESGELFVSGFNKYGQLGTGDNSNKFEFTQYVPPF